MHVYSREQCLARPKRDIFGCELFSLFYPEARSCFDTTEDSLRGDHGSSGAVQRGGKCLAGSPFSYLGDFEFNSLRLRFLAYKMVTTTPCSSKTYGNHAVIDGSYY